jgi:methionyl-tRNA formyltransferase
LPKLLENHEVIGFWEFEQKFGKRKDAEIPKWYLETFGKWTCALLGAHAVCAEWKNVLTRTLTFRTLANRHGVPYFRGQSPNDQTVVDWMAGNDVDIIVIMVGHIIKRPLIDAARIGIINKHAACLPSCKGMFPYFWAKLKGEPLGVSFHVVNEKIDDGRVLLQKRYCPSFPESRHSMLRFYKDVFSAYSELLDVAVQRLLSGQSEQDCYDGLSTQYSFPRRIDAVAFRARNHFVARLSDLLYSPRKDHFT